MFIQLRLYSECPTPEGVFEFIEAHFHATKVIDNLNRIYPAENEGGIREILKFKFALTEKEQFWLFPPKQ